MAPSVNHPIPERNRLLASLTPSSYDTLVPLLEPVHLEQKQVLAIPNEPISHAFFPRTAVISLIVPMEQGEGVESATIGLEGMVGLPLFLGDGVAVEETVVQIEGKALRMPAETFRRVAAETPDLQHALHRYTLALMGQMSRTAGCNRAHPVEERCAPPWWRASSSKRG
jgi:CRP-like cAMP-binding protein